MQMNANNTTFFLSHVFFQPSSRVMNVKYLWIVGLMKSNFSGIIFDHDFSGCFGFFLRFLFQKLGTSKYHIFA